MTPKERAADLVTKVRLRSDLPLPQAQVISIVQEEIEGALRELLALLGPAGRCKACSAPIYWITHLRSQKAVPYSQAGINHFIDCPYADLFRRKRREQLAEQEMQEEAARPAEAPARKR